MPVYENKSFEELRFDDYSNATSATTGRSFGASGFGINAALELNKLNKKDLSSPIALRAAMNDLARLRQPTESVTNLPGVAKIARALPMLREASDAEELRGLRPYTSSDGCATEVANAESELNRLQQSLSSVVLIDANLILERNKARSKLVAALRSATGL